MFSSGEQVPAAASEESKQAASRKGKRRDCDDRNVKTRWWEVLDMRTRLQLLDSRSDGWARWQDQSLGQVGVKSNSRRVKWAFSQNVKTIHTTLAPIWPLGIKSISNSIKSDKGCDEGWERLRKGPTAPVRGLGRLSLGGLSRLAAIVQTLDSAGKLEQRQFLSFDGKVFRRLRPSHQTLWRAASMKKQRWRPVGKLAG